MNLGIRESVAMARAAMATLQGKETAPQIVVCPSATALHEVRKTVIRSRVALGGQNVGPARYGAFTGEIGLSQLEDVGASYVLLGHSERRAAGETVENIRMRLQVVYEHSALTPILCVGRAWASDFSVLLANITVPLHRRLIIAFEPEEAIGSGQPLSPVEAAAELAAIKLRAREITRMSEASLAVLYGGSVHGGNAYQYLREPAIDGVLVGGASLKVQEFRGIVDSATDVLTAQSSVWP
jgi:triosephosphate isomerase